jgi:hypothetical protein
MRRFVKDRESMEVSDRYCLAAGTGKDRNVGVCSVGKAAEIGERMLREFWRDSRYGIRG